MARNDQQRTKILNPAFAGVILDPILQRLENPKLEAGYVDPRHCLVFWARPPIAVRELIANIQQKLRQIAPSKVLYELEENQLKRSARSMAHAS